LHSAKETNLRRTVLHGTAWPDHFKSAENFRPVSLWANRWRRQQPGKSWIAGMGDVNSLNFFNVFLIRL